MDIWDNAKNGQTSQDYSIMHAPQHICTCACTLSIYVPVHALAHTNIHTHKRSPCFVAFIAIGWLLRCIYPDPDILTRHTTAPSNEKRTKGPGRHCCRKTFLSNTTVCMIIAKNIYCCLHNVYNFNFSKVYMTQHLHVDHKQTFFHVPLQEMWRDPCSGVTL